MKPDDAGGDNHPEWSGPDKGTHPRLGLLLCIGSAALVVAALLLLFAK